MIEINLLPGAGRKNRGRSASKLKMPSFAGLGGGGGAAAGLRDPWLVGAVAAALLAVVGIGTLYARQSSRDAELAEALDRATQDSTRYAGVLRDRMRATATRDTILRQLNIIKAVDDERYIWPHILDELSRALPQYTWLTSVSYGGTAQGSAAKQIVSAPAPPPPPKSAQDSAKAKSGDALVTTVPIDTVLVRVVGQTVDIQALTRYMRDLEQSPFLERVQLEKSELVLVDQKEATQFSLLATFTRPDSTVVRRLPLALAR